MLKLNTFGIVKESFVDGPGIRYAVFVQGCPHNCTGCHNKESHSFIDNKLVDTAEIAKDYKSRSYLKGLTLSGGEPFCQAAGLINLLSELKDDKRDVIIYSGYTFEEILSLGEEEQKLLGLCDILIDGKFVEEEKSLEISFRGSKNQRIIDIKKSLEEGKVVLTDI